MSSKWARFWLMWRLFGVYEDVRDRVVKGGTVNYWDLINLVGSGIGAAFLTIVAMHTANPATGLSDYLTAAGSAFVASVIAHLRQPPTIVAPPATPPTA